MSDSPFWSVVVPTFRREKVLCETIQYLLGLSYSHYELLIIDQTPDHEAGTEQFIRACQDRYPHRIRWHFVARANLPHARNVGAKMARGSYLLYCDDDIISAGGSDRTAHGQPEPAGYRRGNRGVSL